MHPITLLTHRVRKNHDFFIQIKNIKFFKIIIDYINYNQIFLDYSGRRKNPIIVIMIIINFIRFL